MTEQPEERGLTERVDERPGFDPGRVRQVKRRDLAVRFAAGALTSIVAGAVTLGFGPSIGGILLAFPAILAASLTLIEEQEDSAEAREDARGAIAGGFALSVFAGVVMASVGHVPGAAALALGAAGWTAAALALYAILWGR